MASVLIEEFPHRPGGHCSSTAMRDILKFYGLDLTEDMVFGLGSGIGFIYFRHSEMLPPVYAGGRIYNLEEHLCQHLAIDMEVVAGLDDEAAWLEVKRMMDTGTPVMVHADVYYLDYLRAKRHFSGHRIVLVGYDEEKGVAFVADNDREDIQECSLENLRKARSASFLPQPADNTFYRFRLDGPAPLAEAIGPAINKSVAYNLRLEDEKAHFRYNGAEVASGIPGLERFTFEMPGWPDHMEPEVLTLLCKTLYVSLEKGGTGYGGNFRRIYGRFLEQSAKVLSDERLGDAGAEFTAIGDLWSDLSLTFKDYSAEGSTAVERALPVAREIVNREKRAFGRLEVIARREQGGH